MSPSVISPTSQTISADQISLQFGATASVDSWDYRKLFAVEEVISMLQNILVKFGLNLMSHYPGDMDILRGQLLNQAAPGSVFAVVLGDLHVHAVRLGVLQDDNEMVDCYTHLANSDRYLKLVFDSVGKPSIRDMDRESYSALIHTPVEFRFQGYDKADQAVFHKGERVARIMITPMNPELGRQGQSYKVTVHLKEGVSPSVKGAVSRLIGKAVANHHGSLFCSWDESWVRM